MYMMRKKKTKIPYLLIILSLLIAAVIVVFTVSIQNSKLIKIEERIKDLEELVTAQHIYRNVIYTEIKENFFVDKRSLFTINYIVTAGVDFSKGLEIKTYKNSIRVRYPKPEILSIDADEGSIDQYFVVERFGKLKQSDYLNIVFDEKDRIREDAINAGILERADKNLKTLITGLLRQGGINNILFDSFQKDVFLED